MGSELGDTNEAFRRAVSVPASQIDLLSASLLIAAGEYPDMDLIAERGRVALLSERVRERLPHRHCLYDAIHVLNEVLFHDLGIRGDRKRYYDPRNRYIPAVLTRGCARGSAKCASKPADTRTNCGRKRFTAGTQTCR